ncbi:MAG: ferritin [Flavobacteriaceae bacterium]|nr:ferritin [Flavobacteriaceae bacterium]
MISKKIVEVLNSQIKLEANASMQYLSMASWAEINGFNGVANFFYGQSEEERMHMIKLIKFVNERGEKAIIPGLDKATSEFDSLQNLFSTFLKSEENVTNNVNKIVFQCLEEKDYTVHNFMQWYVSEQAEEEALARTILDKFKIIGNDKGGLYLFDRDIENINVSEE